MRHGFSLRRIQPMAGSSIFLWDSEADSIIAKRFYFLGRGRQCFAFVSEDGNYVLKLPRTDIYQLPFWTRALPVTTYRNQLQTLRKEREQFVKNSFLLSYNELKQETGLIAIHYKTSQNGPSLKKDQPKQKTITLIDPLGCTFHLPVDQISFLLQRRYPLLMETFLDALKENNREKGEEILDAFVEIVAKRARKNIFFRDCSFLRNFGFDGENGYLIDIGDFYKREDLDTAEAFSQSLEGTMHPLRLWLEKTDPKSLQYLEQKLKALYPTHLQNAKIKDPGL